MSSSKPSESEEEEEDYYLDPVSDKGGVDIDKDWFRIRLCRVGSLITMASDIHVMYPQDNMPDKNLDVCLDKRVIFRRGPNFPDVADHRIEPSVEKKEIDVFLKKCEPGKWKSKFDSMR